MLSPRTGLLAVAVCALLASSACFDPSPAEGVPCSEDGECPEGQGCDLISNTCSVNPRNCPAGEERCDGECTNISNDPDNCGSCGNACGDGQVCANDQCAEGCPEGQTDCDGSCVDLQSDDGNCNACGEACESDRECRAGSCELRCETFLSSAEQDEWGGYWDGVPRAAVTYVEAEADCASFGGRLPTATEIYRVSPAAGISTLGQTIDTQDLWTVVPYDATNQFTGRMSMTTPSLQTRLATSTTDYRCFCPEDRPAGFQSSACFGQPGGECFDLSDDAGHYNLDSIDRIPMRKSAAVWECSFYGGHLANYWQLTDGILSGSPGTNSWLHVADDVEYRYGALIRWVDSAWTAYSNISWTGLTTARAFRCAGVGASGIYGQTIANEFSGPTWKSETVDTAPASRVAAIDRCYAAGGHLPTSTELVELVQQGLPGGTNLWLYTGDSAGHSSGQLSMGVRWSGVNNRLDYTTTNNVTWLGVATDYGSRCVYYPIDSVYAGPDSASCEGGCTELSLAGGGKMWFDSADRAAATFEAANDGCRQVGGRLPLQRDLIEAIRAGLPGGADAWLWSTDITLGNQAARTAAPSPPLVALTKWIDVNTDFAAVWGPDVGWSWLESATYGGVRDYRCMWTNELR